jgi:hypothetical protein
MDVKEPISLAEKFARRSAPATELTPPTPSPMLPIEDAAESYQPFKVGGDHRFEVMVTFRLKNGNFRAMGYSYLTGLAFDPSKQLVMEFTSVKVTITGRNLTPLFKALASHKVVSIWEVDPHSEPTEDAASVVNAIVFDEELDPLAANDSIKREKVKQP